MEKIKTIMIFEIMGKPAGHIIQTLSGLIDKMGEEKGVKILNRKIQEAKKIEDSELFTSFAEVEIEVDSLNRLMEIMFAYMPAHIDIISPSEIRMKNFDACSVCNELITKLHAYDSVAKTLMFEKNNLISQLQRLTGSEQQIAPIIHGKKSDKKKKKKKK